MKKIENEMRNALRLLRREEAVIIPVPMTFFKKIKRGYNQAELFAEKLGNILGARVEKNFLRKMRETKPQAELENRKERLINVTGSIHGKEKGEERIKDKTVIIVDDVYTTGATVRECVREVKKAGVKKIIVFTIARSR